MAIKKTLSDARAAKWLRSYILDNYGSEKAFLEQFRYTKTFGNGTTKSNVKANRTAVSAMLNMSKPLTWWALELIGCERVTTVRIVKK